MQSVLVIGFVIIVVGILVRQLVRTVWKRRQVQASEGWSSTTGTIQSGQMEDVSRGKYRKVFPCFAFSYVVGGEYYSGQFSLDVEGDQGESLIGELIDRKLELLYDPNHPENWYIPDPQIEGHDVHQRLEPALAELYPRE